MPGFAGPHALNGSTLLIPCFSTAPINLCAGVTASTAALHRDALPHVGLWTHWRHPCQCWQCIGYWALLFIPESFYKPRESMWHWPRNVTSNSTFPVTLWVSQTQIENPKNWSLCIQKWRCPGSFQQGSPGVVMCQGWSTDSQEERAVSSAADKAQLGLTSWLD